MPDTSKLAAELKRACRRPLDHVFLGSAGRAHLDEFPALAAAVERVRPLDWDVVPTAALVRAVRGAADTLDNVPAPANLRGSWAELARRVIGAADPPGPPRTYNQRLAAARKLLAPGTSGDKEEELRDNHLWPDLATALLTLPPQQTRPTPAPKGHLAGEIHRTNLYADARWALRGPARVVVLWGESGNGKSYLAQQLARDEFNGQRVVTLREDVGDPSLYDLDLVRTLHERGIVANDRAGRDAALMKLLEDPESFDLVILDNVEPGRFSELFRVSAVKLLVTTRTQMTVDGAASIPVRAYSSTEAIEAAKAGFPVDTEGDLAAFCESVGNRPLVIDLVGRLLQLGITSLKEIRAAVQVNAERALDAAYGVLGGYTTPFGENVSATVVEVYRKLAGLLVEDSNAAALLDVLLWYPRQHVRENIETVAVDPNVGITGLMSRAGCEKLIVVGIIEADDEGVLMNDLTRSIMRVLCAGRMADASMRFLERCVTEALPDNLMNKIRNDMQPASLLDRVTEETENHPLAVILWANYAALLHIGRLAMNFLAPGRDAGIYQMAPNECLVWQRDFDLFCEPSGPHRELAAVEFLADRAVITFLDGTRKELDGLHAKRVHKYRLIHNSALRRPGFYADEPEWGYGAEFWPTTDDGLRHDLITVMPRLVAARNENLVWARCGKLSLLTPHPDPSLQDPCPRCAAFASKPPSAISDTIDDIMAIAWATDWQKCSFQILSLVYESSLMLSWEIGELIFEQPEKVLFRDRTDAGLAMLHSAWIYASYANFLLVNLDADDPDVDVAIVSNIENAVTCLNAGSGMISDEAVLHLSLMVAQLSAAARQYEWAEISLRAAEQRLPSDDTDISRNLISQVREIRRLLSSNTDDS